MAHFWTITKNHGLRELHIWYLSQLKKQMLTTEMAHFWTSTKNLCIMDWHTFENNLLDTKLVEYFIICFSLYRYKDEKNSKKRTDWIIWSWGSCFIICFGSCRCCSRSCCCSCRLRDTTKLTFVWTKHFINFSRAWVFIPTIFETNTIVCQTFDWIFRQKATCLIWIPTTVIFRAFRFIYFFFTTFIALDLFNSAKTIFSRFRADSR